MRDPAPKPPTPETLERIVYHARMIVRHRDNQCEYWTGQGCAAAMVHDAEDILDILEVPHNYPAAPDAAA